MGELGNYWGWGIYLYLWGFCFNKIIGNFKKEEIGENIKEIAKKEREELFHGKTLKVASVEKKEETTGCQVPGFLSNIFAKIF